MFTRLAGAIHAVQAAVSLQNSAASTGFAFAVCPILDAFAGTGTYTVRSPMGTPIVAADVFGTSGCPIGSRPAGMYQPDSQVLVLFDKSAGQAYIMGAVPYGATDQRLLLPGSVGGPRTHVGIAQDPMHFTAFTDENTAMPNYSAGRPENVLPGDWGFTNDLGLAFHIGRMAVTMMASTGAMIQGFWGDDLLRLIAYNYELFTSGMEDRRVNDEGEYNEVIRRTAYPWEGLGIGNRGQDVHRDADGKLKPDSEYAKYEPKEDSQLIIPRQTIFRGYLGDVEREIISAPPEDLSVEKLDEGARTKHIGLADISKSSDGTLFFRSAKGVYLEKYSVIAVAKELVAPEDPKGDSTKNGYKPAGQDVDVKEFKWADDEDPNARQAQLYDFIAWTMNRYTCAGLYKHEKDWYYPDESELSKPVSGTVYDKSYSSLQNKFMLDMPTVGEVKIDHRNGRGSIKYYQSRSLIAQLDDGSIVIEDGYGSSITMKGGSIFFSAPGDVWTLPGRNAITWAPYDAILRAGNCAEMSAAKNDVRIKAEKNLHVLAGNDGNDGGILLETRSTGRNSPDDFGQIGQRVKSKGITLQANDSDIDIFGKNLYAGVEEQLFLHGRGDKGKILITGESMSQRFASIASTVIGAEGAEPENTFALAADGSILNSRLLLGGSLVVASTDGADITSIFTGNVIVHESLVAGQGVATNGGFVALQGSPFVGKLDEEIELGPAPEKLGDVIEEQSTTIADQTTEMESDLVENDQMPGSEFYWDQIGFSFRDSEKDLKLSSDSFLIVESRWQQMSRLGGNGGGETWDEPVVKAPNGEDTYPHPGKQGWTEWSAWGEGSVNNFNYGSGKAEARDGMSSDGVELTKSTLDGGYKVVVTPS